jgi:hypothetical protein
MSVNVAVPSVNDRAEVDRDDRRVRREAVVQERRRGALVGQDLAGDRVQIRRADTWRGRASHRVESTGDYQARRTHKTDLVD